MPSPQYVRVCGRISAFKPDGSPPEGYCLIVDVNRSWYVAAGGTKGTGGRDVPRVLASGVLPTAATVLAGEWVALQLTMVGDTLTPAVNGHLLPAITDLTYSHGMVAVGCGWHLASFDNFSLKPG